jgi:hypothetical protein
VRIRIFSDFQDAFNSLEWLFLSKQVFSDK